MADQLPRRVRCVSELDAAIAQRDFHRLGFDDFPMPEWVPADAAPIRTTARATPEILRALAAGWKATDR